VQLLASAVAVAIVQLRWLPDSAWLPTQCASAIILCRMFRQPVWWYLIHALFMPLVMLALWLDWSPWWYLVMFIVAYALFGRIDQSRVPLYLSNRRALETLSALVPSEGSVLDLGAGTGTVVSYLAQQRGLRVDGVEHAWLPWCLAALRCRWLANPNARVIRTDMHQWPLAGYDVVYAFLSPAAMPSLWQKACQEMRSGTVLVSNSFEIPGVPADRIIDCSHGRGGRLYIWRMP
jgi:hypothetical protein